MCRARPVLRSSRAGETHYARAGCTYLGVDSCSAAIDIARDRAGGLPCRFQVSEVPPAPGGSFDVVLLLETLLAFRDKETLLREVSSALKIGGRFLFTLEEGQPLSEVEQCMMPDADTVWLTPMPEMRSLLKSAGLRVRWQADCSEAHRIVADSLIGTFATDAQHIAAQWKRAVHQLSTMHLLWTDSVGDVGWYELRPQPRRPCTGLSLHPDPAAHASAAPEPRSREGDSLVQAGRQVQCRFKPG